MSIGYTFLNSFYENSTILNPSQISSGLAAVSVAGITMGNFGTYILNIMIIFAVTTTGAGEILAVTSIILNDIYSVYIHVK
jgi:Na+/proline symporter